MKSEQILEALDAVDDRWLQDAKPESTGFGSKRNRLRTFAIAAAAAVILLFSGFTVYRDENMETPAGFYYAGSGW